MKPILFHTDMVRAILEGRKTTTRRVVKEPYYIDGSVLLPESGFCMHRGTHVTDGMPYPEILYHPGSILYARETFHQTPNGQYWYKADNLCTGCTEDGFCEPKGVKFHETCKICEYYGGYQNIKWHPSIHMPREAARIFLRVTGVRVERLQDIGGPEIITKEGVSSHPYDHQTSEWYEAHPELLTDAVRAAFAGLWDSTIKPADHALYGWDANPWVWVIEFERCEKPEGD